MEFFRRVTVYISFILCICNKSVFATTRVSACSGNWGTSSTWLPAGSPVCGDSVIVLAGHTVSISTQQNYNGCSPVIKLIVYGTLEFYFGSKLSLPCGSYVLVMAGGVIKPDVGLSNSNLIEICNIVVWNSNYTLNGPGCLPPSNPMCSSVLSIELSFFKGEVCNKAVCLYWETESEHDNNYFEIERSVNGMDFEGVQKINSLAPGGNSKSIISYYSQDNEAGSGINYYRIKQVDNDLSFSYSSIISVNNSNYKTLNCHVFPNTNIGEFFVDVKGATGSGQLVIEVRNNQGSVIYTSVNNVTEGNSIIKVTPANKIPSGFYFCSFKINNEEQVVKIVVNN